MHQNLSQACPSQGPAVTFLCAFVRAVGHLVEGLPFHKYYFDFLSARANYKAPANTIAQPHVSLLTDRCSCV